MCMLLKIEDFLTLDGLMLGIVFFRAVRHVKEHISRSLSVRWEDVDLKCSNLFVFANGIVNNTNTFMGEMGKVLKRLMLLVGGPQG